MKTLFFTLGTLALLGLVGCSGLKPVGPFAKEVPFTQQGKPLPPSDPASRPPAIRPTPPTMMVAPGDVDPNNPYLAASKLTTELTTDSKATANVPVTVEVSRVKSGK